MNKYIIFFIALLLFIGCGEQTAQKDNNDKSQAKVDKKLLEKAKKLQKQALNVFGVL